MTPTVSQIQIITVIDSFATNCGQHAWTISYIERYWERIVGIEDFIVVMRVYCEGIEREKREGGRDEVANFMSLSRC